MENRIFDLGTVMSLVSGKRFTSMEKIYDALNFLTQSEIYTHQIPRAIDACTKHIIKTYPELAGIGDDVIINDEEECMKFISDLKMVFGDEFVLEPLPKEEYMPKNPIEEAVEIMKR